MITNQTLEQVLSQVDWKQLTYFLGVARYLLKFNITLGFYLSNADPRDKPFSIAMDMTDRPALLAVKSKIYPQFDHWIYWDGKELFDPSTVAQCDDNYDILEVWCVIQHTEIDDSYWETL